MPFVEARDARIYYELDGSGPRLLMIPGSRARGFPRTPSPLRSQFEVLRYDHRGVGQTETSDATYTMADLADDAAALLDAVGWDNCAVLGVSLGGMVAQELVLRHPARVTRLVLACTSSGGAGGKSFPLETLLDLSAEERARQLLGRADTRHDGRWQETHRDDTRTLIEQTVPMVSARDQDAERQYHRLLKARAQHDTFGRLHEISIPVYVCGGLYDGIAPPSNARALAAQIPGARVDFFEGGHGFLLQDPRASVEIARFLSE